MIRTLLTLLSIAILSAGVPSGAWAQTGLSDLDTFEPLAEAFEADAGQVRFVTLLSPSCPYCMKGYRYMLRLMEEIPDERLRVYIVWEPMLSGDSKRLAERQASRAEDSRVVYQAWDEERVSGHAWAEVLEMEGVAWDVYFLYGPNSQWRTGRPGEPAYWQHQLPELQGRADRLDYDRLKAEIEALLAEAAAR